MHPILKRYCILVSFLGKVLGPDYEVVLQDLTDNTNAVIAISNNTISGRTIGAPLTDLALQFIEDKTYETQEYAVNYTGQTQQHTSLRSSTMFIKDDTGKLIGMLCINFNIGKYRCMINNMKSLTDFFSSELLFTTTCNETIVKNEEANISNSEADSTAIAMVENFSDSIVEIIHRTIISVTGHESISPDHFTQNEKIKIIEALNSKGIFLIKGSISEVAVQLASSDASIYRYLSKIKKT